MQRQAGRLPEARAALAALPAEVQRHPIVLTERARLSLAEKQYDEVVRLAVVERRARRDSLLLGEELAAAYERLGRPREASMTAVEVWASAAAEAEWAANVLLRLAPTDGHAGRDGMRRAFAREPQRGDLGTGLARLEWLAGDMRATLKILGGLERGERGPRQRWGFGEGLLLLGTPRDSTGALEVYLDVAGDVTQDAGYRQSAARRYWEIQTLRGQEGPAAARLYHAMKDLPTDRWGGDLALGVARALRRSGDTAGARALLGSESAPATPDIRMERALADLRDGPPEKVLAALLPDSTASDEQRFRYAEALFFAGRIDSAVAWYQRASVDPAGEFSGAALERLYLLEEGRPASALPAFGRIAYEQWRGANRRALVLAESLFTGLPRSALWAQAAIVVVDERERAGDAGGAVAAALAVADSLPGDRLAPLARQRAGDLYLGKLHDETRAIEQYEACVAVYPRAWNAAEVRRRLDELRRSRRF
jgi:tetratricopeptide (TPR) repeat protein